MKKRPPCCLHISSNWYGGSISTTSISSTDMDANLHISKPSANLRNPQICRGFSLSRMKNDPLAASTSAVIDMEAAYQLPPYQGGSTTSISVNPLQTWETLKFVDERVYLSRMKSDPLAVSISAVVEPPPRISNTHQAILDRRHRCYYKNQDHQKVKSLYKKQQADLQQRQHKTQPSPDLPTTSFSWPPLPRFFLPFCFASLTKVFSSFLCPISKVFLSPFLPPLPRFFFDLPCFHHQGFSSLFCLPIQGFTFLPYFFYQGYSAPFCLPPSPIFFFSFFLPRPPRWWWRLLRPEEQCCPSEATPVQKQVSFLWFWAEGNKADKGRIHPKKIKLAFAKLGLKITTCIYLPQLKPTRN